VRVAFGDKGGVGDAHCVEQFHRPIGCGSAADGPVSADLLSDLVADGVDGGQLARIMQPIDPQAAQSADFG
jgi:hypothetical protein